MKFTKIKYDGHAVTLEYQNDIESPEGKKIATVESKFRSTEKPLPSFKEALDDLKDEVEAILDGVLLFGACEKAKIRGVSLSWSNDIMGAVITALIPVKTANSPMTVNTPHLPEKDYNPNGDAPTLPIVCVNKLKRLIAEAERFFNGEREKEQELFGEIA
jgi:hypothetical protein